MRKKKNKYAVSGQVIEVPIAEILPNPQQPRKHFDRVKLLELSQSIAENGILQPLTVTQTDGRTTLLAGERRLRAAKMAGLKTVPCIVTEATARRQALLSMIENLQREDMNCFETAEGIRHLIETYGLTQEDAAMQLGYSQSAVANKLRLLRLSPEERRLLTEGGLTERHARALLRLPKAEERRFAITEILKKSLTVQATESLVERMLEGKVARHQREKPLIRDVRVFFNTVEHAIATMRRGGVQAESSRRETAQHIEWVVRIPKTVAFTEKKAVG